jgi:hypothetical protein
MRTLSRIAYPLAALLLGVAPRIAYAVCNQGSASTADNDLWRVHGCWSDYFIWEASAYDVRSGDWGNRGYFDACNPNLEFPKHWNAAYLISYGLPDSVSPRVQFHGSADYQTTARAGGNSFHSATYQAPTDDTGIFGRWSWQPFDSNKVETSCLLYSAQYANANPASRGGDFIHESWHGWKWSQGYWPDHNAGPAGACTMSGNNCDYFYFHPISQYPFGFMYYQNGTGSWFHSPNQVQVEYLCDVATNAKSWVPMSVRTAAAADANQRAVQRFINGPGIKCSAPTPWLIVIQ